jgi:Kef-type K+ transport system membrane component KefB
MTALYLLQIMAGIATGWVAEYLERTRHDSSAFAVRWVALLSVTSVSIAYAYALAWAMKKVNSESPHHVIAAVCLCLFAVLTYAVRRYIRKSRRMPGPNP